MTTSESWSPDDNGDEASSAPSPVTEAVLLAERTANFASDT